MTKREFDILSERVNNNTFFDNRGSLIYLEPMNIYITEYFIPIQGNYFVGVKRSALIALREGEDVEKVENVKIHYKKVQRLRDNKKYQKHIKSWEYKETTLKDLRRIKLYDLRRLMKKQLKEE